MQIKIAILLLPDIEIFHFLALPKTAALSAAIRNTCKYFYCDHPRPDNPRIGIRTHRTACALAMSFCKYSQEVNVHPRPEVIADLISPNTACFVPACQAFTARCSVCSSA